jgi:hypothetical protein
MASATTSKLAQFMSSETGPKTIHFWVSTNNKHKSIYLEQCEIANDDVGSSYESKQ